MMYSADSKILDRDRARRESAQLSSLAGPLLRDLVNFGTTLVGSTRTAPKAETDPEFPVLSSFLHLLEMCDSVEVLLNEGCASAAIPACRSMFEALLTAEYIAESDSEKRSAAWWVEYMLSSKRNMKGKDHRTAEGKQFIRVVNDDKNLVGWSKTPTETFDRFYESTEQMLAHPRYREAAAEYEATRKRTARNPAWHSLYGGPLTIRDLAIHLRRGGQYEVLYREWSDTVHPRNPRRWMKRDSGFPPIVAPLRDQTMSLDVAFNAVNIVLEALEVVGVFFELDESDFRPDAELLKAWYRLKMWPRTN
jgi:hypothetical protein